MINLKKPHIWLATWFGCGLMKPAPGTWGSLGALPVGLIVFGAGGLVALGIGIFLVSVIGVWAAQKFDEDAGTHDSKMIVIDEVAGMWIALLPALYFSGMDAPMIALAFVLFRFFDIVKPWPVSFFDQKMTGALSVMMDDIAAGLYAALCLTGVHYALG